MSARGDMEGGQRHPKLLLDGLVYPESPRWFDEKLWLVDMHAHRVLTVDLQGVTNTIAELDDRPSAVGFLPDGSPLVVSARKRLILRVDPSGHTVYTDLSAIPGDDFNDMVIDGSGHIYVGNRFHRHAMAEGHSPDGIIFVPPGGAGREVANDVPAPNGLAITPDGRTLIVALSRANRLLAFDIEEDGTLTNRRVFADFHDATPEPRSARRPSPDGICLDAEGGMWMGSPGTHEFLRILNGGEITERIRLPASRRAVACALGGKARRSLFLVISETTDETLAAARLGPEGERTSTSKGWIEVVDIQVPGAGWP